MIFGMNLKEMLKTKRFFTILFLEKNYIYIILILGNKFFKGIYDKYQFERGRKRKEPKK